jgi:hypothetical protein
MPWISTEMRAFASRMLDGRFACVYIGAMAIRPDVLAFSDTELELVCHHAHHIPDTWRSFFLRRVAVELHGALPVGDRRGAMDRAINRALAEVMRRRGPSDLPFARPRRRA